MLKLFAVGVHFVVVLAVAHTVLLRDQLLHKLVTSITSSMDSSVVHAANVCLRAIVNRDMDLMKILSLRFAPPLQSDLLLSVALRVRTLGDMVVKLSSLISAC